MNKIVPIKKQKQMKLKDPDTEYEKHEDRELQDNIFNQNYVKLSITNNIDTGIRYRFSTPFSSVISEEVVTKTSTDAPTKQEPLEEAYLPENDYDFPGPLDNYSDEELIKMSDSEIADLMEPSANLTESKEKRAASAMSELLEKMAKDRMENHFSIKRPLSRSASSKVVEDEHKNEIPSGVLKEKAVKKKSPYSRTRTQEVKPLVYPENGHYFLGHLFSRKLLLHEDEYLRVCGYFDTIKRYPDLEFIPKEQPINEEEECIVIMSELADCLAIQECEDTIEGFNLKLHNKEYQTAYKKHIKNIERFKRNKNG